MYMVIVSIGGFKIRLEIIAIIIFMYFVMFGHLLCGCSKVGLLEGMATLREHGPMSIIDDYPILSNNHKSNKPNVYEGFVGSNNIGNNAGANYIMNTSTWNTPSLNYRHGTPPDKGVKAIWDRPKQPIPLPKDELAMFATTEFKAECCPNSYSTSSGCACMTVNQYNYLRERGSNNV